MFFLNSQPAWLSGLHIIGRGVGPNVCAYLEDQRAALQSTPRSTILTEGTWSGWGGAQASHPPSWEALCVIRGTVCGREVCAQRLWRLGEMDENCHLDRGPPLTHWQVRNQAHRYYRIGFPYHTRHLSWPHNPKTSTLQCAVWRIRYPPPRFFKLSVLMGFMIDLYFEKRKSQIWTMNNK